MSYFGLENINRTLILTLKHVITLGGALFLVCLLLNTLILLLFSNWLVILSVALIYQGFQAVSTYTVPCSFVDRFQQFNCYFSVSSLSLKNTTATLFVVSFSLNVFFLLFSCTLSWNCMNHEYCSSLHSKYMKHTLFLFFITAKNLTFTFHDVSCPSKVGSYVFSNFQNCNYVTRYLVRCFFPSKYVGSTFFLEFKF